MLFGQFLVDRKKITKPQLVEALVRQLESSSSLLGLLWSEKVLGDDKILELLDLSEKEGLTLQESLKKMGVWTPQFWQDLTSRVQRGRKPLGLVLVDMGAMSLQELTRELDEYWGEMVMPPLAAESSGSEKVAATEPQPAVPSSAPASEESQIRVVLSLEAQQYVDSFSDECKGQIENILSFVSTWNESGQSDQQTILTAFQEVIHRLLSIAHLAGLSQSSLLLKAMEDGVRRLLSKGNAVEPSQYSEFGDVATRSLDSLWSLREALFQAGSEPALQEQVNQQCDGLAKIAA